MFMIAEVLFSFRFLTDSDSSHMVLPDHLRSFLCTFSICIFPHDNSLFLSFLMLYNNIVEGSCRICMFLFFCNCQNSNCHNTNHCSNGYNCIHHHAFFSITIWWHSLHAVTTALLQMVRFPCQTAQKNRTFTDPVNSVHQTRLELARVSPHAPQACVSTDSTTGANAYLLYPCKFQ